MDNLNYKDFRTQPYLLSGKISTRKKKFLFKTRTRMVNVGDNFGKKKELCPVCLVEFNTQRHLTECTVLKQHCPQMSNNTQSKYADIFGCDPGKMKVTIDNLENIMRKRDQLISQTPT